METNEILSIITFIVTLLCGILAKKCPKISNQIIPIQNILIGLIFAVVEWVITKNFSTAIALSGIVAGGAYDTVHNLVKIYNSKKKGE